MERESFIFYRGFYEAISCLEKEQQAECYQAIAEYALNGVEVEVSGIVKALFLSFKPQIDANNRKREKGMQNGKKGAEYGKLGGRPKKENPQETPKKPPENPQDNPQKPANVNVNVNDNVNANVNDNENVNVNVNVNDNENVVVREKTQRFFPPTLDQVKDYCWQRKNNIDAQKFIDYYTARGWMIGKTKMKDWKAAVRTWERQDNVTPIRNNKQEVDDFFRRELGV